MAVGKGVLKVGFSTPTVFFALHIIYIIEERCAQSTFVAVVEPRTSHRKGEFIGVIAAEIVAFVTSCF